MKRMAAAALAALLMTGVLEAAAQQPGRPFGPPGRGGEGRFSGFDPGRGEPQRARDAVWPQRPPEEGPGGAFGPGRMSPEERQQLRRDINAHGRDIYRHERERR